jgi:uncharacterized protein YgiM (DUF1202 family)
MIRSSRFKLLIVGVAAVFVVVLLAETLIVKVQSTYLRKEPKFYAPVIATLKAGESVTQVDKQGSWLQVKTAKGQAGWVHSSAVKIKKFRLLAMDKSLKTQATAEEVALAGKGFNKQVEQEYRSRHKGISFSEVERMLKMKVTPNDLRKFLEEGKLGEFGGAR